MSSQYIKVVVPEPPTEPRGALWAANVALWIGRALSVRPAPVTVSPSRAVNAEQACSAASDVHASKGAA